MLTPLHPSYASFLPERKNAHIECIYSYSDFQNQVDKSKSQFHMPLLGFSSSHIPHSQVKRCGLKAAELTYCTSRIIELKARIKTSTFLTRRLTAAQDLGEVSQKMYMSCVLRGSGYGRGVGKGRRAGRALPRKRLKAQIGRPSDVHELLRFEVPELTPVDGSLV